MGGILYLRGATLFIYNGNVDNESVVFGYII